MKKVVIRLKIEPFSEMLKKKKTDLLSPDFKSHGDYCYFHDDLV